MNYRFDTFELDTDRHELRFKGETRGVEPQVFALLRLLVENCHRMVSRDEIVEVVWEGRAVSDSAVSSRVKSARRALGDDGENQRLIRTVHGKGFRFVGELAAPDPVPDAASELPGPRGWAEVLSRPLLAVLPFENEGGRPEDHYFIDGIAEELIAELSSWRWFPIVSRNSSFDRSLATLTATARASAMGARYVLTGRFLRAGTAARLAIELLDAATNTQLWSACFPCEKSDLAQLQAEIANRVFHKIAPELTSAETRRVLRKPPGEWTAWDLTLKGLWHLHRATPNDFSESLRLLGEATRVDPGFALPWSLIALTQFEQALKGWTNAHTASIRDMLRGVLGAAAKSLEIDPTGWMGHALASVGELWTNGSFPRARFHADRAIELNPSGWMAYHFSGCIRGFTGDLESAIAMQSLVYRYDPGYAHLDVVEADLGLWHLLSGDFESAQHHLDRSLGINPSNMRARQRRIVLAGCKGDRRFAEAGISALREMGGVPSESYLLESYPLQDPRHASIFRKGLVASGLLGN
jgi:TolB-like protein/DNA-binding winged helix-turn-helix (wHTH) protein